MRSGVRCRSAGVPLGLVLLAALAAEPGSETLTLSSAYPSPAGVYARIITTGTGSQPNTILARDGGRVGIGNVPSPAEKLEVAGNIRASQFLGSEVNVTGNVTAAQFNGSGAGLTGITTANLAANKIPFYRITDPACSATANILTLSATCKSRHADDNYNEYFGCGAASCTGSTITCVPIGTTGQQTCTTTPGTCVASSQTCGNTLSGYLVGPLQ